MKSKFMHGISLLEVLLVLAVAGIIIAVSVRYFQTAEFHNRVATAIRQINTITKASYTWLQEQNQPNFNNTNEPGGSGAIAISIQELIDNNLIDESTSISPWDGQITVGPGTNPSQVRISIPGLDIASCKQLVLAMQRKTATELPIANCTGSNITYYGDF